MRKSSFTTGKALRGGVSLFALAAMAAAGAVCAAPAQSADTQAAATDNSTEVVIVGVRRALKTAQQIKKNADTQVDSITASDIGAFPDKSVAEALQRVPGITVTRFAASDDSSHFSAEPSGVLIRGLTEVRTEFNGPRLVLGRRRPRSQLRRHRAGTDGRHRQLQERGRRT
ncbi:MAG: TonB-dependent receptor plug domain-containing protein [Asticcacaulis sp.]